MAVEIKVTVPERIAKRLNDWAQFTKQDVSEMVATALDVGLPELSSTTIKPVQDMPDHEVLETTKIKLEEKIGSRISELTASQKSGTLTEDQRSELTHLMRVYHETWVLQAQAIEEAVHRGLMQPLSD